MSTKETTTPTTTENKSSYVFKGSDPATLFANIQTHTLDKNLTQKTSNIIKDEFLKSIPDDEKDAFIYDLAQCFGMWVISNDQPSFNGNGSTAPTAARRQEKWKASVDKIFKFITLVRAKKDVSWGSIKLAFKSELASIANATCDNVYAPRFLAQSKVLTCLPLQQAQYIMDYRNNAALYVMEALIKPGSFANSSIGYQSIYQDKLPQKPDKSYGFVDYFDKNPSIAVAASAILDYTGLISYAFGQASSETISQKKRETTSLSMRILIFAHGEEIKTKYAHAKKQIVMAEARAALAERKRSLYIRRVARPKGGARAQVSDSFDIADLDLDIDGDFKSEDMSGLLERDEKNAYYTGTGSTPESSSPSSAVPPGPSTPAATPSVTPSVSVPDPVTPVTATKSAEEIEREATLERNKAIMTAGVNKATELIGDDLVLQHGKDYLVVPYSQVQGTWNGTDAITTANLVKFLNGAVRNPGNAHSAKLLKAGIRQGSIIALHKPAFNTVQDLTLPAIDFSEDLIRLFAIATIWRLDQNAAYQMMEQADYEFFEANFSRLEPYMANLSRKPEFVGLSGFDPVFIQKVWA